jgi:hypothetical protein
MSNNNQFKLQIGTPCHENWDNMSQIEKGRFCGSCQKMVVDFSTMTEAEIVAFFENYRGQQAATNVCGRFKKTQLAQSYSRKDKNNYAVAAKTAAKSTPVASFLRRAAVGLGLIATLGSAALPAQAAAWSSLKTEQQESRPNPEDDNLTFFERMLRNYNSLRGKVVNENNTPVAGVTVEIYYNGEVVATTQSDKKGKFKINYPKNVPNNASLEIHAYHSHQYHSGTISLKDFQSSTEYVAMLTEMMLMGDVMIDE